MDIVQRLTVKAPRDRYPAVAYLYDRVLARPANRRQVNHCRAICALSHSLDVRIRRWISVDIIIFPIVITAVLIFPACVRMTGKIQHVFMACNFAQEAVYILPFIFVNCFVLSVIRHDITASVAYQRAHGGSVGITNSCRKRVGGIQQKSVSGISVRIAHVFASVMRKQDYPFPSCLVFVQQFRCLCYNRRVKNGETLVSVSVAYRGIVAPAHLHRHKHIDNTANLLDVQPPFLPCCGFPLLFRYDSSPIACIMVARTRAVVGVIPEQLIHRTHSRKVIGVRQIASTTNHPGFILGKSCREVSVCHCRRRGAVYIRAGEKRCIESDLLGRPRAHRVRLAVLDREYHLKSPTLLHACAGHACPVARHACPVSVKAVSVIAR